MEWLLGETVEGGNLVIFMTPSYFYLTNEISLNQVSFIYKCIIVKIRLIFIENTQKSIER